jgi:outer membrane protein assembly factor BamB
MSPPCRALLAIAAALTVASALAGRADAAVPAWTTYRHDAARSGLDPDSTSPVTPSQVWQTPELDGEVYGQPLVYGTYVYVATENDTVYKLDAASGAVVWTEHLATPEPSSSAPCGDISPTIGITSTPVIDPVADRIYVVGAVLASGAVRHELFALDLSSGRLIAGVPITVDPPFPSGGAAVNQLQRAGLALDRGRLLIGYGGNDGDCSRYWGWLVSAPTDGTAGLTAFQVDSDYAEGAIWAAGNAPAIDAAGNVFLATGNGNGDSGSDPEYGDSVVKLDASAAPLDWWAPPNWQSLDSSDADLGSSMPTLLPGGLLFQSGKDGSGYLLNDAGLGHVTPAAAEAPGFCPDGSFGGSVYDSRDSTIYAACADGLRAISLGQGSPPSLTPEAGFRATSDATGPPMIAAALVWVTDYASGTLDGLDPTSGATKSRFSIPENGSQVNHFATPSAAGGRLFVGSGDQVTAYQIAQAPGVTATRMALLSSANPAPLGAAVTLTASVAPAPDAGTVTFSDGGVPISGCSGIGTSAATSGRAVCRVAFQRTGMHALAASYSGDSFYAASTSIALAESVTHSLVTELVTRPPATHRVTPSPVISRASIVWRGLSGTHTAILRVTLSEAVTLTVVISQLRHGHLVAHRCSTKRHRGKSCYASITLVRFHFHARAGRNKFKLRLQGRARARYRALIYATVSGARRSRTTRIGFTILRGAGSRGVAMRIGHLPTAIGVIASETADLCAAAARA